MSKKSIKRLSEAFKSYDLTVSPTTLQEKGKLANGSDGLVQVPAFQANITIFEHGDKGAVILKKSSAYGVDQDQAIEFAVDRLGV